jgi:Flp pilus assembly protein protease CpaA
MGGWGVALGAPLLACVWDLKTGRIPNWLTLPCGAGGLWFAAGRGGWESLGEALAAGVLLSLPYVLLFALGQGGAGDAKLMGAVGAWLGLRQGLVVLVCVALVGAAMALLRILACPERRRFFHDLGAALYVYALVCAGHGRGWRLLQSGSAEHPDPRSHPIMIPYGTAIFLGVCLAALVVHLWMP